MKHFHSLRLFCFIRVKNYISKFLQNDKTTIVSEEVFVLSQLLCNFLYLPPPPLYELYVLTVNQIFARPALPLNQ